MLKVKWLKPAGNELFSYIKRRPKVSSYGLVRKLHNGVRIQTPGVSVCLCSLLFHLEPASGSGSLQEFPPSDPHSKEKARRTKERQEGPKAAVFPLLSFSEVLLPPKSCLRLTGQKLVQRPYPGAVELGTGISKLGTPLLHLKIKSTSYECKQRM